MSPSLVQLSLSLPRRLPAKRLHKADDTQLPAWGHSENLSDMKAGDPENHARFSMWTSQWPVGNGHGPTIEAQKRAALPKMSPGMAALYDEDAWNRTGDLQRRVQVFSPNLPAWQGRDPSFMGISFHGLGRQLRSWLDGAKRPDWLKPGLPSTAAGTAAGAAAGVGAAALSNYLDPEATVDTSKAGLLGATLGGLWGYGRKN